MNFEALAKGVLVEECWDGLVASLQVSLVDGD